MIEFQQAPKKDEPDLGEMVERRRRVAEAREMLEKSVETARLWKGVKKADTLILGGITVVLGGACAGLYAGPTALAETHPIWSMVLGGAWFVTCFAGLFTLTGAFINGIAASVAATDLEEAEAKLAAFDATPVNELELEEVSTE